MIGVDRDKNRYDLADLTGPLALWWETREEVSADWCEHCDVLIKLPMRGHITSLNAAVAGSIALAKHCDNEMLKAA